MSRLHANLSLLLTAMIWGSAFAAQKLSVGLIGPFAYTSARLLLGWLVILPVAVIYWRKFTREGGKLRPADWRDMGFTGCALCLGALLQQIGISMTSVTNAGFLTGLYVPLVPVIVLLVQRIWPHPVVWPAVMASLLGTYLLSGGGSLALAPGDLLVVISAFFWAIHVILVGRVSSRTGLPTVLAAVQYLIAGTISGVVAFAYEGSPLPGVWAAWPEVAYVGIFSVGVGFTLQGVGQRYTTPADAAIILSSEAVFSAIGGMLVFGDRLNGIQWLGCAAILGAILAVQLWPQFFPHQVFPPHTEEEEAFVKRRLYKQHRSKYDVARKGQ